jgi:hypothetical protein
VHLSFPENVTTIPSGIAPGKSSIVGVGGTVVGVIVEVGMEVEVAVGGIEVAVDSAVGVACATVAQLVMNISGRHRIKDRIQPNLVFTWPSYYLSARNDSRLTHSTPLHDQIQQGVDRGCRPPSQAILA